ncbi:MAG TPA: hypothetical protein VIK73_08300 [Limnochordales bacterium]
MKVRIVKPGRVYHGDRIRAVGEELDVPEAVARAWARAGVAEIVTPAPAGPEAEQPQEPPADEPPAEPPAAGPAEKQQAKPEEDKESKSGRGRQGRG